MEKKSRNTVSFMKLCSYEKAIVRSICVFVALLVASTAFSGFCSVNTNANESKQIRSTAIDFAASAENIAIFRDQYNTLQTGNGKPIADEDEIKTSKEAIGDAVENMYSAALSLNFQKSKMMESSNFITEPSTEQTTDALVPGNEITQTSTQPPVQTTARPTTTVAPTVTEAPTKAPAPTPTELPVTAAPETTPTDSDSAYIAAASVNTISVKTPPATLMLDQNGVPVNYKKVLSGNASAYAGDGGTATGTVPVPGTIAVNPKIIPYGTKMWIVSNDGKYVYGYAVAEDTGGFVKWSNAPIADLFFDSEAACNAFGRRNITIYVLE